MHLHVAEILYSTRRYSSLIIKTARDQVSGFPHTCALLSP